jgi:ferredoxin-NADP reductase
MEWTLGHKKQDTRGIRRYFTIASSPTEDTIRMGVKFYEKPSSYKQALDSLHPQDIIVASGLAGDFTLPKNQHQKLVFLAGGIGVTPFRSMIKYLTDINEKRDIIMFYANGSFIDIAYQEVFDQAHQNLGIKTIYTLNNLTGVPADFDHQEGLVTRNMIVQKVPDYQERVFYISGPRTMIESFQKTLKEMGIPKRNIKTDFFPGFA